MTSQKRSLVMLVLQETAAVAAAADASSTAAAQSQQQAFGDSSASDAQQMMAQVVGAASASGNASDATLPAGAVSSGDGGSLRFPLYMRLVGTLACIIIFTVGVCGNLLVPLVVMKTKYLRNSTNLFLINLSIADLLVLIVCMPTVLFELHSQPETWLLGESICKLSNYVEMLAANGSISTILAISFERYYAICKPLKAGYKCTRPRAAIIICLIWILSCILTSPVLIMAKSSQVPYYDGTMVYNCILATDTYWFKMYVFVSMFAFFCLPLLVLMLVYWLISRRLIRENVAMMDSTNRGDSLTRSRGSCGLTPCKLASSMDQGISPVPPFKRPDSMGIQKSSSTSFLTSLLRSIKPHVHYRQKLSQIDNDGNDGCYDLVRDDRQRSEIGLSGSPRTSKITSQMSVDAPNSGQRKPLVPVGKALSLDYGGSRVMTATDNEYHALTKATTQKPSITVGSKGQSSWSGKTAAPDGQSNTHLSSADITATATTSSTATDSTDVETLRTLTALPSSKRSSLPSRIPSSSLAGILSKLASIGNLSSRFRGVTSNDHNDEQDKTGQPTHGNKGARLSSENSAGGLRNGRVSADLKMSSPLCDTKLVLRSGATTTTSENEQDLSDVPLMRSNNIICRGCESSIAEEQKVDGTSRCNVCHRDLRHMNHGAVIGNKVGYDEVRVRNCSPRCVRRSLESKRQRRDSHYARSMFKWFKGVSVTSSTGSTYTNSTLLSSDTRSVSPSLQCINSCQPSTPSPPGLIKGHRATETNAEFSSLLESSNHQAPPFERVSDFSRSCSPEKALVDRKRSAYFNDVDDLGKNVSKSSRASKLSQTSNRASYEPGGSFHANCSEVKMKCANDDRSLSPASSSTTTDEFSKSPLPEAHATREQYNSLHQQRQLYQHNEENSSDSLMSNRCNDAGEAGQLKGGMTPANYTDPQAGSTYRQSSKSSSRSRKIPALSGELSDYSCHVLGERESEWLNNRRISEDDNSRSRLHNKVISSGDDIIRRQNVTSGAVEQKVLDNVNRTTDSEQRKSIATEERVVNVLNEVRASLRTGSVDEVKRTILLPIDAGLAPLRTQYKYVPSPSGRISGRYSLASTNRHIGKVNLVALAHNLSDNLHIKRHNGRSGSHPVVSHNMHVRTNGSTGGMAAELTVRDVSKRQQMDSRRQVVAMLAFVVACFFLLFLPYRVFTIWLILSTDDQVQSLGMETYYNLAFFSRILIYLHSAINPIAYNLISTKFRRAFMSILLCRGSATRRNFTADPHRFLYDSKGQINNNQNRSTATANGAGSRGPRSPLALTKVTK